MFHISRRLTYGIQLMAALSSSDAQTPLPTARLSKQLDIPLPFLHQIGHSLMQAGLIKATPGPHGGLRLNQEPGDISLLMIMEALEGPIHLIKPEKGKGQARNDPAQKTWQDLEQKIIAHLSSKKLNKLDK